jgi:hypothetical protein
MDKLKKRLNSFSISTENIAPHPLSFVCASAQTKERRKEKRRKKLIADLFLSPFLPVPFSGFPSRKPGDTVYGVNLIRTVFVIYF